MKNNIKFENIAIIGLGLIGSSLALALKKHKIAKSTTGYAKSAKTRQIAKKLKLVSKVESSLEKTVKSADLVIICTPLSTYKTLIGSIRPYLKVGAIISDVGSAKSKVMADAEKILGNDFDFIPAHPIAGTEQSGPEAGFSELFINRWCIVTPYAHSKKKNIILIKKLWQKIGSSVEVMTPEHHDRVLAITSHLPHLIAYNIVNTAADLETVTKSDVIKYSASGFRDFTRIASSDPTMWRDIFINNKEAVLEMIGRFSEDLSVLQKAVRWGDAAALFKLFSGTRKIRKKIIAAGQDIDTADFGRVKKKLK
jgi:cyclohexadieny/prephenate dehydrogenase|tara:strand:- start:16983 stop:17912 length:930 start_codon:yes stop_codon:yes gene_type:complete